MAKFLMVVICVLQFQTSFSHEALSFYVSKDQILSQSYHFAREKRSLNSDGCQKPIHSSSSAVSSVSFCFLVVVFVYCNNFIAFGV